MVGVAGKSKACHDCKRRRVKCDFRKPSCVRCEKAGRACEGYDKNVIFVNRTLTKRSTDARMAISEARLHRVKPISKPIPTLLQEFEQLRAGISDQSWSPMLYRSQAWLILKELYLPRCPTSSEVSTTATSRYSWLSAVCQMKLESGVLDQSLLAFCAIQVFIAEPWSVPLELALQMYSKALSKLAKDLGYTQEQFKDETLAAIVVLSTCELFVLPNDQGWRAHAQGISALLRNRPPMHDTSILWQQLCSRLRLICVIDALAKGKRLALEPDTWRQVLCTSDVQFTLESLMEIVCEVPLLMEKSNELIGSGTVDEEHLLSLLEVIRKIGAWQQAHRVSSLEPLYWAVPSQLHNPSDDGFESPLFPFALEYRSLNSAMLFMFGSGVMLQMLTAAARMLELPPTDGNLFAHNRGWPLDQDPRNENEHTVFQFGNDVSLYSLIYIKQKADNIARFICQSIEYCCRQETGTVGAQASCHPQYTLRNYFQRVGLKRELEWCKNIKNMGGPGLRRGIDMMMFGYTDNS